MFEVFSLFTMPNLKILILVTSVLLSYSLIIPPTAWYALSFGDFSLEGGPFSLGIMAKWLVMLTLVVDIDYLKESGKGCSLIFYTGVLSSLFFKTVNIVLLYVLFEMSVLPIMVLILGWGSQPERLFAVKSFVIYTLVCSFPLLAIFVFWFSHLGLTYFDGLTSPSESASFYSNGVMVFLILGFLVKLPVYPLHLWLPKAHVEAPVYGSMLLAGVLLKLGGLGLYRVSPFLASTSTFQVGVGILVGGILASLICVSQVDTKILIAYSSVAHMALVVPGLLLLSVAALKGGFLLMVTHGFSSSSLFLGSYLFYKVSGSRNLLLCNNMMSYFPSMGFIWFLSILASMSTPPFTSFFAEIWICGGLVSMLPVLGLPLVLASFLCAAYSVVLYSSIQQGSGVPMVSKSCLNVMTYLSISSHLLWALLLLPLMGTVM